MQCPGTEWGLSIGFTSLLLSFYTIILPVLMFSPRLSPPGQNSGMSNSSHLFAAVTARMHRMVLKSVTSANVLLKSCPLICRLPSSTGAP